MTRRIRAPFVVCLGLLTLVLSGEAFFRLAYPEQLKIFAFPGIYKVDSKLGYRYVPNAEGTLCVPSICKTVKINERGFYGPSFSLEKKIGVRRIAIVGASNATGIWLDGEQSFSVVLQELFDPSRRRLEVMNFSIDGAGRGLGELMQIEDEVLRYQPDIVLWSPGFPVKMNLGIRDHYRGYNYLVGHTGMKKARVASIRRGIRKYVDALMSSFPAKFYEWSYILRAVHRGKISRDIRRGNFFFQDEACTFRDPAVGTSWMRDLYAFQRRTAPCYIPASNMPIDMALDRIALTRERVRVSGSSFVMFAFGRVRPALRKKLAERSLRIVALNLPLEARLFLPHDGHLNLAGHQLVAERLFQLLTRINKVAREVAQKTQRSATPQ